MVCRLKVVKPRSHSQPFSFRLLLIDVSAIRRVLLNFTSFISKYCIRHILCVCENRLAFKLPVEDHISLEHYCPTYHLTSEMQWVTPYPLGKQNKIKQAKNKQTKTRNDNQTERNMTFFFLAETQSPSKAKCTLFSYESSPVILLNVLSSHCLQNPLFLFSSKISRILYNVLS